MCDQDLVFNFSSDLQFLEQGRINYSSLLVAFHFWILRDIVLHPKEIKPYSESDFMKISGLFTF